MSWNNSFSGISTAAEMKPFQSCINNTPMVVTADDGGIIKVWDIRKLTCL